MKIRIQQDRGGFTIWVPVGIFCSKWLLRFGLRFCPGVPGQTADAVARMAAELKRQKKRYKHLTLVEATTAQGEQVRIEL